MKTLLILTAGQSDLQLVVDGARRELSKKHCAKLHDEIKQRSWRPVASPADKLDPPLDALPPGDLELCAPKLDAVLCYLDKHDFKRVAALVLETCRDATAEPGDPRYAGTVLEHCLKARGVERVHRKAYLQGAERLEGPGERRNAIVRRDVVRRLEQAVRETVDTEGPDLVVTAATGGFSNVTNLVEEMVRLHASAHVEILEVTDGAKANPPTGDRAVERTSIPEPLTSFQARRRALELVGSGNLLGAWAIAEPLHADEVEHAWTQVIEWLACFAASLPMPVECDVPILKKGLMAVRVALRVDLALRMQDVPRAVHGTAAFFEAALWDWLRAYDYAAEGITKLTEQEYQLPSPPTNDQKKRFRKSGSSWRVNEFKDGMDAWRGKLQKPGLDQLWKALDDDIRNLRNDVAHNEPTPKLIKDARGRMVTAKLWSNEGTFLSQPLIQNVLRELGEAHPESLCDDLLQTVSDRLRSASLSAGQTGQEKRGT